MKATYEFEEIRWVPLEEWPLEDSDDGQDTANLLAPDDSEWVRRTSGERGYSLMRYKGEYNDE